MGRRCQEKIANFLGLKKIAFGLDRYETVIVKVREWVRETFIIFFLSFVTTVLEMPLLPRSCTPPLVSCQNCGWGGARKQFFSGLPIRSCKLACECHVIWRLVENRETFRR